MAVAATFLWAGSYILNKLAFLGGIGPLTLSGLRNFLVSMILFAIRKGKIEKQAPPLAPRVIILLGTLGKTIAQWLQYVGHLTPTQSSLFLRGQYGVRDSGRHAVAPGKPDPMGSGQISISDPWDLPVV